MSKSKVMPQTGWVRESVVLTVLPFGRTKLREEITAGRFPAPRRFGPRMIAWDAQAVHQWIDAQRGGEPVAAAKAAPVKMPALASVALVLAGQGELDAQAVPA